MDDTTETLLERAIEAAIPLSFRYWKPGTPADEIPPRRVVSPYELKDGKDGNTLLVCWYHGSEGVRSFHVDQIAELRSEEGVEEYVHPVSA